MARGVWAVALVAGVAGVGSAGMGWAAPGDQLWEARYNGAGNSSDGAYSLAPSPDGTRVFVTGRSTGSGTTSDYATIAYDAPSGTKLWEARYNGAGNSSDGAGSLAVSPEGTRVFVTGSSIGSGTYEDYATIAYDASSGAQLWAARYNGPGNAADYASSLASSPDGTRVFVTGQSYGSGTSNDYATIAYDAATGAQIWEARYNGPANSDDLATSLGLSPDGTRVFVTGWSYGPGGRSDYATIAYDLPSGAQIWEARYNGPGDWYDWAYSLASSPDGTRVFVTGVSYGAGGYYTDYATIAYDARSGATFWEARYNGPGNSDDGAYSLASSPDGTRVYVTGESYGSGTTSDYATIAYDARSGSRLWEARYNGPGNYYEQARTLAPSPDGTRVFVTGRSTGSGTGYDYATIAYDAPSGATLWEARYNGPGNAADYASSLASSPDGTRVFVTGVSVGSGTGTDYTTITYDTGLCTRRNHAQENGPLSGPVHGTIEPATDGLQPTVHQVNCGVVAANGL